MRSTLLGAIYKLEFFIRQKPISGYGASRRRYNLQFIFSAGIGIVSFLVYLSCEVFRYQLYISIYTYISIYYGEPEIRVFSHARVHNNIITRNGFLSFILHSSRYILV